MSHHLLLILHLIAASVWVGGHLLLCTRYLPKALKQKDPAIIKNFEQHYEPIGLPALAILVISGILMAYDYNTGVSKWFHFSGSIERIISLKLSLLFLTLGLAIHARVFIIPRLKPEHLHKMAWYIVAITLTGLAMLLLGSFIRFGGI